jgi:tetratricopeptide (TPR) repeat protein
VGDFWKYHGAAALASMTEERDHHITLVAQTHSHHHQLLQEEVTKRKTEENTIEVLKLCEEADKLSSMRDYHAAEQCYLHVLKILQKHAQSLCNYAHLLHTCKKELDKTEELFKKALQAEPHRAPTLFNYAAYLLKRGQVREGRDMYTHACELNPINPWIQENGHLFQDAV